MQKAQFPSFFLITHIKSSGYQKTELFIFHLVSSSLVFTRARGLCLRTACKYCLADAITDQCTTADASIQTLLIQYLEFRQLVKQNKTKHLASYLFMTIAEEPEHSSSITKGIKSKHHNFTEKKKKSIRPLKTP